MQPPVISLEQSPERTPERHLACLHNVFVCHRMEHPARGVMDEFADITLEKGAWPIFLARQSAPLILSASPPS